MAIQFFTTHMIEREKRRRTILGFPEVRKLQPYQTVLYFSMLASGVFFLALFVCSIYFRFGPQPEIVKIEIPKMYVLSTVLLLLSSVVITQARRAMREDQLRRSVFLLIGSAVLALGFAVAQVFGSIALIRNIVVIPGANSAALFVYAMVGMHLLHLIAAFVFMGYVLIPAYRRSHDKVSVLIYVTNPYEKTKIDMLAVFWHYLDAVWLTVFFYFLIAA